MQHNEAHTQIYFTNEYAKFKMIVGNRQLNEGKIKKIITEISNGNNMLKYYPIQVKEKNDRLEILDGQHRFYICKHLKHSVFYIIVKEEKSMSDIARVNSNVEKWKPADYINCYAQQGNNNYEQLREFIESTGLSNSLSIKLLHHGHPGVEGFDKSLTEDFKNGLFEVKNLALAHDIVDEVNKFKGFIYFKERGFVIAIYRIKKANKISIDELAIAFNKKPGLLTQQASYKEYIYNLEQIINSGKQNRIVIY